MVHVKSEKEIDLMRAPCAIVRDCLSFIKASGAEPSCLGYGGFPASACVSVNEVVVHGIPDDRVLEEGDIVSVDLCAYKNGFHGDGARTFAVGEISPEKKKLIRVTEECFFKALEGLRAGTPLFDIGYRVQTHAESNGARHRTGDARRPLRLQLRKKGDGDAPQSGHGHLHRTDDRDGGLARERPRRRLDGSHGG